MIAHVTKNSSIASRYSFPSERLCTPACKLHPVYRGRSDPPISCCCGTCPAPLISMSLFTRPTHHPCQILLCEIIQYPIRRMYTVCVLTGRGAYIHPPLLVRHTMHGIPIAAHSYSQTRLHENLPVLLARLCMARASLKGTPVRYDTCPWIATVIQGPTVSFKGVGCVYTGTPSTLSIYPWIATVIQGPTGSVEGVMQNPCKTRHLAPGLPL